MKNLKKSAILSLLCLFTAFSVTAQTAKASPAQVAKGTINGAEITINYSSPSVKNRVIWGELVPFGKVWRAGANEATTIETSKEIAVEGQKLQPGTYSLFIIPENGAATVIINKVAKQWGSSKYDQSQDVLRVKVKPVIRKEKAEQLQYRIESKSIVLAWDNWDISFKVK